MITNPIEGNLLAGALNIDRKPGYTFDLNKLHLHPAVVYVQCSVTYFFHLEGVGHTFTQPR